MKGYLVAILVWLLTLGGAFLGGRAYAPAAAPEVREKVVYKDRVVEKLVEVRVKDEASNRHQVVKRVKVTRPDGTVQVNETLETRSESHAGEKVTTKTESTNTNEGRTDTLTRPTAPKWTVGVLAVLSPGTLRLDAPLEALSVGLMVNRHVAGPVWVGLSLSVPVTRPVSWPFIGVNLSVAF